MGLLTGPEPLTSSAQRGLYFRPVAFVPANKLLVFIVRGLCLSSRTGNLSPKSRCPLLVICSLVSLFLKASLCSVPPHLTTGKTACGCQMERAESSWCHLSGWCQCKTEAAVVSYLLLREVGLHEAVRTGACQWKDSRSPGRRPKCHCSPAPSPLPIWPGQLTSLIKSPVTLAGGGGRCRSENSHAGQMHLQRAAGRAWRRPKSVLHPTLWLTEGEGCELRLGRSPVGHFPWQEAQLP